MDYFVTKRVRTMGISGPVNLKYGTVLTAHDGIVYYKGSPLCYETSQVALDHLAADDDGRGEERGKLISSIRKRLEHKDPKHQERWDRVWADPIAAKYRQQAHRDYWLWDTPFISAPLGDLDHILEVVNGDV